MPKYLIKVYETWVRELEVEAETESKANEKWTYGEDMKEVCFDYSHTDEANICEMPDA